MAQIEHEGFTPGPWSLAHFAQPNTTCKCGYVLVEAHMGAVATVHASCVNTNYEHGDNPPMLEAMANARLIADAPKLLAQLLAAQAEIAAFKTSHAAQAKTIEEYQGMLAEATKERDVWKKTEEILADVIENDDVGFSEPDIDKAALLNDAHAQAVQEAQEKP